MESWNEYQGKSRENIETSHVCAISCIGGILVVIVLGLIYAAVQKVSAIVVAAF